MREERTELNDPSSNDVCTPIILLPERAPNSWHALVGSGPICIIAKEARTSKY